MINGFQLTFKRLCGWIAKNGAAIFAFALPLHMLCSSYALVLWFLFSLLYLFFGGYSSANFLKALNSSKSIGYFIVLYLLLLIGMLYTKNSAIGFEKISICLPFLILPVLFWLNKFLLKIRAVFLAFFAGLLISIFLSLLSFLFDNDFNIANFYVGFNLFHHPSYYSMLITLAIALFLFQFESIAIAQWIRISIIVFCALLVFLISSKAGVLVTIGLFFIKSIHVLRSSTKVFPKLLILFTVVALSVVLFQNKRVQNMMVNLKHISQQDTPIYPTESTAIRWKIWEKSTVLISSSFLFGYGTGDANDQLMDAYNEESYLLRHIISKKYNAHNTFFQLWLMVGVLGPAIVFVLLICLIKGYRFSFFSLSIALIFFLNFFLESMLERHAGVMIFTFFICLLIVGKDSPFFQRKLAH